MRQIYSTKTWDVKIYKSLKILQQINWWVDPKYWINSYIYIYIIIQQARLALLKSHTHHMYIKKERNSLFVGNNVNTGIVKGGWFRKEWSNDGHRSRNVLWVWKWCPQTDYGVWRPSHQEHDNHHHWHLGGRTKCGASIKHSNKK